MTQTVCYTSDDGRQSSNILEDIEFYGRFMKIFNPKKGLGMLLTKHEFKGVVTYSVHGKLSTDNIEILEKQEKLNYEKGKTYATPEIIGSDLSKFENYYWEYKGFDRKTYKIFFFNFEGVKCGVTLPCEEEVIKVSYQHNNFIGGYSIDNVKGKSLINAEIVKIGRGSELYPNSFYILPIRK